MKSVRIKHRNPSVIHSEHLTFGIYLLCLKYKCTFSEPIKIVIRCKGSNEILRSKALSSKNDKSEVLYECKFEVPYTSVDCEIIVENPRECSNTSGGFDFSFAEISLNRVQAFVERSNLYQKNLTYDTKTKVFDVGNVDKFGSCYMCIESEGVSNSTMHLDVKDIDKGSNLTYSISATCDVWRDGIPINIENSKSLAIRSEKSVHTSKNISLSIYNTDVWEVDQNQESQENIGVIIPIHDTYKLLQKAISSILHQTLLPCIIYLVDDCSPNVDTDLVNSLIRQCAQKGVIVQFFRFKLNVGPYICKNFVLSKYADRHTFWTFLDSDDYYSEFKLKSQVDAFASNSKLVGCYTYYSRVTEDAKIVKNRGLDARRCYASLMIMPKVLKKIGFFDSVRYGADEDYHNRMVHAFGSSAVHSIEDPHYLALLRSSSLTNNESLVDISTSNNASQETFLSPTRLQYAEISKSRLQDPNFSINFPPFRSRDRIALQEMHSLPSIYIHIATFPKRFGATAKLIDSLLEKYHSIITKINLCLNEVGDTPIPSIMSKFSEHPCVEIYTPTRDLKDNGKFISIKKGINLWLDDDMEISPTYVEYMILNILQHEPNTLLGLHGWNGETYNNREVYHFRANISDIYKVRVIGTGLAIMYITKPSVCEVFERIADNHRVGMVDLLVARACAFLGIERYVIAHDTQFITPKYIQNSPCLYEENKQSNRTKMIDSILSQITDLENTFGN